MYYFGYARNRKGHIMAVRFDSDVLIPKDLVGESWQLTSRESISSLKSLEKKFPYNGPKKED